MSKETSEAESPVQIRPMSTETPEFVIVRISGGIPNACGHFQTPTGSMGTSSLVTYNNTQHFLDWTPDGLQLVLGHDEAIWVVNEEGDNVRRLVSMKPWGSVDGGSDRSRYGFYGGVSPDGSEIVYSTCQWEITQPTCETSGDQHFGYEIAAINLSDAQQRRLSDNDYFDHYPVWSPDGTSIAFISVRDYDYYDPGWAQLAVMPADGSEEALYIGPTHLEVVILADGSAEFRSVGPFQSGLALHPPMWSPDGKRLAFVTYKRGSKPYEETLLLYTVRPDGSEVTAMVEITVSPSWSPDGQQMAIAGGSDGRTLYLLGWNGSGLRELWSGKNDTRGLPISQVAWSPDGSSILFVADSVYVIRPDGSGLRRIADVDKSAPPVAAWAPDRARIAMYYPGNMHFPGNTYFLDTSGQVVSMAPDGTDVRIVHRFAPDGAHPPWNASSDDRPVDGLPDACPR